MKAYDILNVMRRRMQESGIYKVDGTTLIDAELSAYAAGFQLVLDDYEILQRELFVQTAEDYGITRKEALMKGNNDHLPLTQRREMLLKRLSVGGNDYTVSALEQTLDCIGITAKITEMPTEETIIVTVTDISRLRRKTEESAKGLADQFMPAHLKIIYDFTSITT